jgi:hypothetical protein
MDMRPNQPMERTYPCYALRRRSSTRDPANKVRYLPLVSIFVAAFLVSTFLPAWAESTCYGTPSKGRIEGAVQLPESGSNFSAYTSLGVSLGRTYVHERVRDIVVAAYSAVV